MALTRVQSNMASGTSLAPSVDIGSVPASGDLVVVVIATVVSRTISLAGYTLVPTDGNVSKSSIQHSVFYKIADGAGGTDVITGSISGTGSPGWRMIASQYNDSGGGTWTLDKSAHNSGSGLTANSGTTAATTTAVEVWIAALSNTAMVTTQSAPTNGFTLVQGANSAWLYEKIVAATGAASVSATIANSIPWVGTVATFYSVGAATPANTVAPVASGTATVGSTVSTTNGTWTNTPTSFTYQWQRDGHGSGGYTNIGGATSSTYVLVDADDACHVRCSVIGVNASGAGAPAVSNALGVVAEPAPTNSAAPVVSGTLTPRARLLSTSGTWTHMGGYQPEYGYQWQSSADGSTGWADVTGATFGAFTLHAADVGSFFRCAVAATNTGGSASAVVSNVLGPVIPIPSYRYVGLVPSYDLDNVFNRWTATRDGGSPQTWDDAASQEAYFLRAKQTPTLVSTDSEALNQAQWKIGQFSQPIDRVESVTVMPLVDLDNTPQVDAGMGRELGDRITILETPPGFSTQQERDYVIQHIEGHINVGPIVSASVTWQVQPASLTEFWVVGDGEKSQAGISTRAAY